MSRNTHLTFTYPGFGPSMSAIHSLNQWVTHSLIHWQLMPSGGVSRTCTCILTSTAVNVPAIVLPQPVMWRGEGAMKIPARKLYENWTSQKQRKVVILEFKLKLSSARGVRRSEVGSQDLAAPRTLLGQAFKDNRGQGLRLRLRLRWVLARRGLGRCDSNEVHSRCEWGCGVFLGAVFVSPFFLSVCGCNSMLSSKQADTGRKGGYFKREEKSSRVKRSFYCKKSSKSLSKLEVSEISPWIKFKIK